MSTTILEKYNIVPIGMLAHALKLIFHTDRGVG